MSDLQITEGSLFELARAMNPNLVSISDSYREQLQRGADFLRSRLITKLEKEKEAELEVVAYIMQQDEPEDKKERDVQMQQAKIATLNRAIQIIKEE